MKDALLGRVRTIRSEEDLISSARYSVQSLSRAEDVNASRQAELSSVGSYACSCRGVGREFPVKGGGGKVASLPL